MYFGFSPSVLSLGTYSFLTKPVCMNRCLTLLIFLLFCASEGLASAFIFPSRMVEDTIPACTAIFPVADTLVAQLDCGETLQLCTNIPLNERQNFTISVNGTLLTNTTTCNFDTIRYYSVDTALTNANLAPYYLEAWRVNNTIFSGEFLTVPGLIDSMNRWDTLGNWQFDAEENRITGGHPANLYGAMQIEVILLGTTKILGFRRQFIPKNVSLTLPVGQHQLIATNQIENCQDTLIARFACTHSDTIELTLEPQLSRTICLTGNELLTTIQTIETQDTTEHYSWDFAGNDCLRFTGKALGRDTAEFLLCDSLGICDRVVVFLHVRPASSRQASDVVGLGERGSFCFSPTALALPGEIVQFQQVCSSTNLFDSLLVFNFKNLCLEYQADVAGRDTLCISICDEFGNCDTIDFALTVVMPHLITDTLFLQLDTAIYCLNTSGLDSASLYFLKECRSLSNNVDFSLDTSYCVTYFGQHAGRDSTCIWLADSLGNFSLTVFSIIVEQPVAAFFSDTIFINQTQFFCPDAEELVGVVNKLSNYCPPNTSAAVDIVITDDFCVEYTGQRLGEQQLCLLLCDDKNFCDTTYLTIYVADYPLPPIANPDTIHTPQQESIVIPVQNNDNTLGGILQLDVVIRPTLGTVTINSDGTLTYFPSSENCEGTDAFSYSICNPIGCDTGLVVITVSCSDIVIYNAVSPNGDGINDVFYIANIEARPQNTLSIYNRWGNLVYQREHYANDWHGTWNGKNLPDGTYFYVLEIEIDGEQRIFRGYLELHR